MEPGSQTRKRQVTGVETIIDIPQHPIRRNKGFGRKSALALARLGRHHLSLVRNNRFVLIVPAVLFVILLLGGGLLVFSISRQDLEETRNDAYVLAMETSAWFSDQLQQATLPLFTMAQFVQQLNDTFGELPGDIGDLGAPNSLPLIAPKNTHRNVSGVCDQDDLVNRFNSIAAGIKRDSNMEGVLVNVQLAPNSVVCLVHPLNNTEDFEDGIFMDNTGAVGHDLLSDPERTYIAKQTLASNEMTIAGPLSLRQCSDCDPTVERAFIARLPIDMPSDHNTDEVDGGIKSIKDRWGFAVVLINWEALISGSDIDRMFNDLGWEYQLTRTDHVVDPDTGETDEKVVILANSMGYLPDERDPHRLTIALETTNNEWEMTVCYYHNKTWIVYTCIIIAVLAVFISGLVYMLLAEKQLHAEDSAAKSAQLVARAHQAAEDERDLNDFIAHEVRNPLSAAMSACTFVSASVHEAEPLVTPESRACVREDVQIIEGSLKFINDLLRSMLDIHRATSKQLVLDYDETDILRDILEPVSAMLYRRDESFVVEVDCPENLLISADRLRLQQVVLNLGRNAAKFVEGGFVCLRAYVEECDGDQNVCISVEDSGPGIPLEKRANLFDRFQKSLDLQSQGTGIGLNLSKLLVDAMGGEIFLDETYDSGSEGCPGSRVVLNLRQAPRTVHVELEQSKSSLAPTIQLEDSSGSDRIVQRNVQNEHSVSTIHPGCAVTSGSSDEPSPTQSCTLPQRLNVLLVDDERILRKLAIRSILKLYPDWHIREAASGEIALRLCEESNFDLILMDQYMTSTERQLTGTETTRELRCRGHTSVICGLSANDLGPSFLKAGADHFLMKPFPCKPDQLRQELIRLMQPKETLK